MRLRARWLLMVAVACAAGVGCGFEWGCSKPWVRPYRWQDERAAVAELARRAESVRSVRAACGLTLASAGGDSVNFDGAINVRADEQERVWLRLRAWKLSRPVFDLTVRPDGVWVMASEEAARRQGEQGLGAVKPEQIAAAWSLFMGRFFSDPGLAVIDSGGPLFIVRRPVEGGGRVECTVDRESLTVQQYVIVDARGATRQTLTLSQYREAGPDATPWPMRIAASGPEGTVEVRLEDVELNAVLEDEVFTPARRAVKQP